MKCAVPTFPSNICIYVVSLFMDHLTFTSKQLIEAPEKAQKRPLTCTPFPWRLMCLRSTPSLLGESGYVLISRGLLRTSSLHGLCRLDISRCRSRITLPTHTGLPVPLVLSACSLVCYCMSLAIVWW